MVNDPSRESDPGQTNGQDSWFLYLIECLGGSIYTGITNNVAARYAAHAAGKGARYTRSHPPVKLLGSIAFPDRSSASKAEYGVKQLSAIEKRRLVATLQPDAASQKAPVVAEPDSCA